MMKHPELKITFDTEAAVKKEAARFAQEQARYDAAIEELKHAEAQLEKLTDRARELSDLVPLGGATKQEAADYANRAKVVSKTVDRLREAARKQEVQRDRAAAVLEKAQQEAQAALEAEARRIASEHMDRLFKALSEVMRANLEVYLLKSEIAVRGMQAPGIHAYPVEGLLPRTLQSLRSKDRTAPTISTIVDYKQYIRDQTGLDAGRIYDAGNPEEWESRVYHDRLGGLLRKATSTGNGAAAKEIEVVSV